jgi:hypothetical protein
MKLPRLVIVLSALVVLIPPVAHAGPPFLTDDPVPVPLHHWEAYLFSTSDHGPGGTDIQGPAAEFNLGAAPELQLHLVVPWAWSLPAGGRTRSGLGDVETGVKLRLLNETKRRPQVGIFPFVELPTGDAGRGLGNGRVWFRLPLWAEKSWGPWTVDAGAGWVINHAAGQRDHAFGGALLQRELNEKLTLGGEIFSEGADTVDGRGSTVANVGGYLDFTPGFSLLFSGGHSIAGESHTIAYLGLYWTWGPHAS